MKNITFSADEHRIEQARAHARSQKTTLNQLFRDWIDDLARVKQREKKIEALFKRLEKNGINSGKKFTRDELNER